MLQTFSPLELTTLLSGLCLLALVYAMVGHGGGSGYLAALAIAGLAPETLRPLALTLNIFVASIGTFTFNSNLKEKTKRFVPLILTSIPCSFLGGTIQLDPAVYKPVLAVILAIAAVRLFYRPKGNQRRDTRVSVLLVLGAAIGLISGMIGIGGGIFLSPILLLFGFASAKETAAISAPFILCNSIAAMIGVVSTDSNTFALTTHSIPLIVAVVIGGAVGAHIGSRRLGQSGLRFMLAIVLTVAAIKMMM